VCLKKNLLKAFEKKAEQEMKRESSPDASTEPSKHSLKSTEPSLQDAVNTSDTVGISQNPSGNWRAQIFYAGHTRYLGVFKTQKLAAQAHDAARGVLQNAPLTTDKAVIDSNISLAKIASKPTRLSGDNLTQLNVERDQFAATRIRSMRLEAIIRSIISLDRSGDLQVSLHAEGNAGERRMHFEEALNLINESCDSTTFSKIDMINALTDVNRMPSGYRDKDVVRLSKIIVAELKLLVDPHHLETQSIVDEVVEDTWADHLSSPSDESKKTKKSTSASSDGQVPRPSNWGKRKRAEQSVRCLSVVAFGLILLPKPSLLVVVVGVN